MRGEDRVEHRRRKDAVDAAAERQVWPVLRPEVDDRGVRIHLGALDDLVPPGRGRKRGRAGLAERAGGEPVELEGVTDVVSGEAGAVVPANARAEMPGHAHRGRGVGATLGLDASVGHGGHRRGEVGAPVIRLRDGGRRRGRGPIPEQPFLNGSRDHAREGQLAGDAVIEQRGRRLPDSDCQRPSIGRGASGKGCGGVRPRRRRRCAAGQQDRERGHQRRRHAAPGAPASRVSGDDYIHERALCPARIVEPEWSMG